MTAGAKLGVMSADLDVLVALMPFAGHLGLVLEEASPDRVIARLDWAPYLCTSGGIMHGGVLMSLADTVGALVTFLGLPEGATTATITSTSQLFRPVGSGSVRAAAVPLNRGRTTVTAQTSLYDSARTPGRPDHADPGRPAASGACLERRSGSRNLSRIFSPRALPGIRGCLRLSWWIRASWSIGCIPVPRINREAPINRRNGTGVA